MQRLLFSLIPWIFLFAIGYLAGDRYGAPAWMSGLADKGFSAIESAVGGAFGGDSSNNIAEPSANGPGTSDEDQTDENADDLSGIDRIDPDIQPTPDEEARLSVLPANRSLRINADGLTIIKDSEGLALEPYSAGGHTYIGYGHQLRDGESYSSISESKAESILKKDIAEYEQGVRESLTQKASRNQFSAMVSLAYNKGVYGFRETEVLKKFNEGDVQGAADDFRNHTGRERPLPHLVERRERERMLFLR